LAQRDAERCAEPVEVSLPNWKEDFYALGMQADTPILGLYNVLLLVDGLKRLVNKL
jgi:hypothetical protein